MNTSRTILFVLAALLCFVCGEESGDSESPDTSEVTNTESEGFLISDTSQSACYDDQGASMDCPAEGAFSGQDAQIQGHSMSLQDNGDGTITDINTGLMWTKSFTQTSWSEASSIAASLETGGYNDWRVPSTTELYSLIQFNGNSGTAGPDQGAAPSDAIPFLDSSVFDFEYGQQNRYIDAQYVASTKYVSTTMGGDETFFGVNFADGRIKGYPTERMGLDYYAYFVRGDSGYGTHDYLDNGDETITDGATGLIWMKYDNGHYDQGHETYGGLNWEEALAYCEGSTLAGHDDWRLPNAKELQYLVDYSRSPDTTQSAAIDPIFDVTPIIVEDGSENFPFFWTSTTHIEGQGSKAAYVAFGQAFGFMSHEGGDPVFMDVHGAGCQRSDPKVGDPEDYPTGFGPQGDVIRIYNYVRCVRDEESVSVVGDPAVEGDPQDNNLPTCEADEDCAQMCPSDAGCACVPDPNGEMACVPACNEDNDCPAGMQGETMQCLDSICVPKK